MPDSNQESPARAEFTREEAEQLRDWLSTQLFPGIATVRRCVDAYLDSEAKLVALREALHRIAYECGLHPASAAVLEAVGALAASEEKGE